MPNVVKDLQLEISNLKNVLRRHSADVTKLTSELREARTSADRLRKALNAALIREGELKEQVEEVKKALPHVLTSEVYMCSVCAYEVVDGYCQGQGCGLKYVWPPMNSLHPNGSISATIYPAGVLICRCNTSPHDIDDHDFQPPEKYRGPRCLEYRELLSRGATRLICEAFHLEYTKEGIHAWADWEIYRDFAFPQMQMGDLWKTHLGRRIQLDEGDLDGSIFMEDLLSQLKQRDARILKLTRELKEARRYINALTRSTNVHDDEMELDEEEEEEDGGDKDDEDDDEDAEINDDDEEEQEAGLPQVLVLDNVYACCNCGTEVLDGVCHNYECGMEHQWPPDKPCPARRHARPRSRADTFCITTGRLYLEYTYEGGIYAWADSDIFDEFSQPLMKHGDTWKIHLGRRIELEQGDLDGSTFIEDLLEDTVGLPANIEGFSTTRNEWETKEETPGVWVTRMKAHVEDEQDEEDHSDLTSDPFYGNSSRYQVALDLALEQPPAGGAIALNEYLSDSNDDQEEDFVQSAVVMSEDDDDYASHNSKNSDSEDVEVYDTAFASLTGPDLVWDSDMDDSSEGENLELLDGNEIS